MNPVVSKYQETNRNAVGTTLVHAVRRMEAVMRKVPREFKQAMPVVRHGGTVFRKQVLVQLNCPWHRYVLVLYLP